MATVLPFKGILYNPEIITDSADVTTPPYDVIPPGEQQAFHERHPNNVIRLILGQSTPADTPRDNPHTRSAAYFREWMTQGVLKQDDQPALYLKAITYAHGESSVTRYGLIARVGIEAFEKRIILPHEKTFSKVKSERLELLKATHCNYCPIFSLYPDEGFILGTLEAAVDKSQPAVDFTDEQGHRHRLWRIIDPAVHARVTAAMQDKRLFIADGHHRYETSLNFKKHLQATDPTFNDQHPANYVLMYLCSMSDPGLIILPAHRLVKGLGAEEMQKALNRSRAWFNIADYPFAADNRKTVEKQFLADLEQGVASQPIGIYTRHASVFHLLTLRSGVMEELFGGELDPALQQLDVTVLTRLLFMTILEFDQQRLDDATRFGYASTADKALAAIDSGDFDAAFILNPTRIEQVQEVAQKGLIMPRKSTYFYPKVRSGLVMNTLAE
ncbi:DUF1015 domain-containing protein [Desulfosarcina ovata]|uniref:Phosphatase n=1 Tax=Desulfosarcina ovata subsp. ovata TaxID=2752305 RepID=A0A5K8A8D9_9BACT|nr:DUF1015 domain-containing protein [Desulfosarcina ovata]BBO88913.1 hypothetical protein DSCOOX_20930 [Desulfosarcina ovata subsp. ovata]